MTTRVFIPVAHEVSMKKMGIIMDHGINLAGFPSSNVILYVSTQDDDR